MGSLRLSNGNAIIIVMFGTQFLIITTLTSQSLSGLTGFLFTVVIKSDKFNEIDIKINYCF